MKKFLFLVLLFISSFIYETNASISSQEVDSKDFFDISDEFVSLKSANHDNENNSSQIEAYLFRLFKLYRHFEQKFPDKEIENDLKPEIRRLLPRLTDQEVYDYEDNIRFIIKNYRGIKNLITKIKEKLLAPEPQPIDVTIDELKLYNEPYIETDGELIVIYDPMKIVPYAVDKKNFLATEAAIKRSKIQSETEKKLNKLKQQISMLEWRKIPFYNVIYPDPFTGSIGIGEWAEAENVKVRILHNQTTVGTTDELKTVLNIYPRNGYFIPDYGEKTIKMETANSKNIADFILYRPLQNRINILSDNKNLGGYIGSRIFPLKTNLQQPETVTIVEPKITFPLCNINFECQEITLTPKLSIDTGVAQYTSMNNMIQQHFNAVLKEESDELKLQQATIYTSASDEEYLKIKFKTDNNVNNFEFYISTANNIEFTAPIISIHDNNIDVVVYPIDKKQKINGMEFEVTAKSDNINIIRKKIQPNKASIFDADKPTLSWGIIWLAFIGGFLLNLMPCVFPVLGLKIISLSKFGASIETKVRYGFLYTLLGIISAFAILICILLILKYIGFVLGWGMQFQSVEFLLFIAIIIIVFFLQICGVINIKTPQWVDNLMRSKSNQKNMLNYLSGFLLVLLSTPCSAPYLGTALGFALAGSYGDIIIILTAVMLGLSLPYWLLVVKPQWAKLIPHPGKWMKILTYLMNIMLLLTFIWILSIMAVQTGIYPAIRICIYLLLLVGIWYFTNIIIQETNRLRENPETRAAVCKVVKIISLILSCVLLIIAVVDMKLSQKTVVTETNNLPIHKEQSTQIKKYLKNNQAVLIAIGADWCLTCKFNDFVVINNFKLQRLIKNGDLILLASNQVDYQPETLKFMEKYGRKSLPFYLLYTPKIQNGIILPEILSDSQLYKLITEGRY